MGSTHIAQRPRTVWGRWLLSVALTLFAAAAAHAQQPTVTATEADKAMETHFEQAQNLLQARQPEQAIREHIDPMLAHYEQFRKPGTRVYSPSGFVETLKSLLSETPESADVAKTNAVAYSSLWGNAYYLKAFALVDLKQLPEALNAIDAAIQLAPYRSMFHSERGAIFDVLKNPAAALASYQTAEQMAREFSPEARRNTDLTRALRGQGYALIEAGRLDEATQAYEKVLVIDAYDKRAAGQLNYIVRTREKQADDAALAQDPNAAAFVMRWRLAEAQLTAPSIQGYVARMASGTAWTESSGAKHLLVMPGEKAAMECLYALGTTPMTARLVFDVDATGTVTHAAATPAEPGSACLASRIVGHRVPPPPRAFQSCARYARLSATEFTVQSCGGAPYLRTCSVTQDGNQFKFNCRLKPGT